MPRTICSYVLITLLLAACGSGASESVTPAPTAANAPSPRPTASAGTDPTHAPAAATTTPAASNDPAAISLQLITNDVNQPVYVTHAGDGSGRLFVVEKAGTIALLRDGKPAATPFLDITSLVVSIGSEQGLLGLAFHPDYAK